MSATDAEINTWRNEMSEKSATTYTVLHLRFKLQVPPDVLHAQSRKAATIIASVEGLIWKIWVLQREEFEMGGVYLFANRETAEAYLKHPVIQAVCSNPAVVSTESQLWDIESSLSALTRAPLEDICAQYGEPEALMAGGR
jgi:putative monooxygenase ydhR